MLKLVVFLVCAGLVNAALIPKIVNGDDADIEDYPYQISLQINGKHQCGGSIISVDRILTAAHCTYQWPASQLSIRAGSSIREQGGQEISVAENHFHPGWNNPTFDNDVAVLVLTEPLVLNNRVQIIPLGSNDNVPLGDHATITGWGITENETLSTVLQKLQTQKVSDATCKEQYSFIFNENTMVCYGDEFGKSICSADSGGPLVYNGQQVGIVSFGSSDCDGAAPMVYARVEAFLDYIQSYM